MHLELTNLWGKFCNNKSEVIAKVILSSPMYRPVTHSPIMMQLFPSGAKQILLRDAAGGPVWLAICRGPDLLFGGLDLVFSHQPHHTLLSDQLTHSWGSSLKAVTPPPPHILLSFHPLPPSYPPPPPPHRDLLYHPISHKSSQHCNKGRVQLNTLVVLLFILVGGGNF